MLENRINEYIGKLIRLAIQPHPGECHVILGNQLDRRVHELFSLQLAEYGVPAIISSVRSNFTEEWFSHISEQSLLNLPKNVVTLLASSDIVVVTGSAIPSWLNSIKFPESKFHVYKEAFLHMLDSGTLNGNRWFVIPVPSLSDAKFLNLNYEHLTDAFWQLMDIDYEAYALKSAELCEKLKNSRSLQIYQSEELLLEISIDHSSVIILDGYPLQDQTHRHPETIVLPKGELILTNLSTITFHENLRTAECAAITIKSGNPAQKTSITSLKESWKTIKTLLETNKSGGALSIGLNGTLLKCTGYSYIDSRKIGNVSLLGMQKRFAPNYKFSQQDIEFFITLENIAIIIDNKKIIENNNIVF